MALAHLIPDMSMVQDLDIQKALLPEILMAMAGPI
jgi:hypothetical protein